MNVLYISSVCSKSKFDSLFRTAKLKPAQQAQKYHQLMVYGLANNTAGSLHAITALPINRKISSQFYYESDQEVVEGLIYHYLAFINFPVLRSLFLFLNCFFKVFKYCLKDGTTIVICDILNITVSSAALLAAKLTRQTNIGIVTDVPSFLACMHGTSNSLRSKIISNVNTFVMNHFNSFVFLTEEMNKLINKRHKPYVVIEGQVDNCMLHRINTIEGKQKKRICIYSGAIHKVYGIKMLVEAFVIAAIPDSELHIYGSGDFEEELKKICKTYDCIKYFGVVPNDIVVEEQLKATLLINPRPTDREYTKYSFPSKNMEYMVSGTPVLTTALPGMPEEYKKYVFIIEKESVAGIAKKLSEILMMDKADLHEVGKKAREFVLEKKNNRVQSEKILKMVYENFLM